jgi:hypothetical protein
MPQEVQTGIWITQETTLETIEAVGTSSFKIREWRQTTPRYLSWCKASGDVTWHRSSGESKQWPDTKSTDTAITDNFWKQEYKMIDWWVAVPVAWTYEITLFRWGGSSIDDATMILKAAWKTLYTKTFTSYNKETVTLIADLGKFETIEIRGNFNYKGSSISATLSFSDVPTLTIQQL